MDSNITNNKYSDYYKQWRENNADKLKQARDNWYNSHKDTEEYKQKRKEYNQNYYQQRKVLKEVKEQQ